MQKKRFFRRPRREIIRVNQRIRAPQVRVILATTEEQLGVMSTRDAVAKAKSMGLDLVEIAPNAKPPVCKIVDYGKYRYDQAKQKKERKTTTSKLKEIKLRVNIDKHDYEIKMRRAEGFLNKGWKLRVHLIFRGRQLAHKELGFELLDRVKGDLAGMAVVDMDPKKVGRNITMNLSPLPESKRNPRFIRGDEDFDEDEEDQP